MARGPFEGTYIYNARPTVTMAPDAVVIINGDQEIKGCDDCNRKFNLNRYITSITTQASVDSSGGGSASLSLSIPSHSIDEFYFDGQPIITPMMEVEIYGKGAFLLEGVPQNYPIFWGIVTEVTSSYSSGEHTVSITCADILKWWDISKVNINSSLTAPSGSQGRNIFGNVFTQSNPYDIIFSLAQQSFGDMVAGAGSAVALVREISQNADGSPSIFDSALSDMMAYWETRFAKIRSSLVLYGATGVAVRGSDLFQQYSRADGKFEHIASTAVKNANDKVGGAFIYDPASPDVSGIRQVPSQAGQIDLWQSEFQTKLEIANAAKDAIGFEFYMDVTGDIVFKPPFYNLDVISNKPVSWIQDIDIIDCNFSLSEADVVTQIVMSGQYAGTRDIGQDQSYTPTTTVTDYHLLRKYGWRTHPYSSEFMASPQLMFLHGLDLLDRLNSRQWQGSITIPMRPEMRLGFPVYLPSFDEIWYVTGISHNLSFGGRATTQLTLTAKRSKFIAPKGIGDLKLTSFDGQPEANKDNLPRTFRFGSKELSEKGLFALDATQAATIPADPNNPNSLKPLKLRHPKTGRIVGYPNVVMAYTRPFEPHEVANRAGLKNNTDSNPYIQQRFRDKYEKQLSKTNDYLSERFASNIESYVESKYLNNSFQYGLNSAGVFIYAHDSSAGGGVISETLLIPIKNITVVPARESQFPDQTAMIRPISDERGFEVIGHYPYGRRLYLRDGRLIVGDPNSRVQVDLQLSLSGGLREMLQAQSQGLTSVITTFQDPASTLASLTPEDSETAATMISGRPEFVDVGDNFITTATLESPERAGTQSVEASQLSRSLTLAEIAVIDEGEVPDVNCPCLTGKPGLEFISEGYQLKSLTTVAGEDVSNLSTANIVDNVTGVDAGNDASLGAQQRSLQFQITQLKSKLSNFSKQVEQDGLNYTGLTDEQEAVYESFQRDLQSDLENKENELSFVEDAIEEGKSRPSVLSMNQDQLVSKVQQYLVSLYRGLDDSHQEFEKAIRGELLPRQEIVAGGLLNQDQVNPPSEFEPPFSAPNRFQVGDPKAAVGDIDTSAKNIANAWKSFGSNLKNDSERAQLTSQLSQDQASVQRLNATKDQLEQSKQANVQEQIDSIDKQLQTLQQRILRNETKLSKP